MCRRLAPTAPSMPSARSRRCAITLKPATASRPTNSSPMVASTSTATLAVSASSVRIVTPAPSGRAAPANRAWVARNSTVTWSVEVIWPGATSAKRSSRFSGFSTRPTTVRCRPPWSQVPPTCRSKIVATLPVTAISFGPRGYRPASSRSVDRPYRPRGSCARRSTAVAEPGTGTFRCPITSVAPNAARSAARSVSSWAPVLVNVTRWSAVPNRDASEVDVAAAAPRPTVVAATATSSSASTSDCCRHSRRNSRHAQRTTARRAAIPPWPPPSTSGRSRTSRLIAPARR
jgi:hypothetical protein